MTRNGIALEFSRRKVLPGLATLLVLASCSDQQPLEWKPESDAERKLRESRENLQRTVGEGGLVGAGGGALIGAAVGGVGGAFRGAQVGRISGSTAGLYVKQIQSQFAEKEAQANKILLDIRATNARLEQSIAAVRSVTAEKRQRAAQLASDQTRDARTAEEAQILVSVATDREELFTATRALVIENGIDTQASGIDNELARLQSRVRQLAKVTKDLAEI